MNRKVLFSISLLGLLSLLLITGWQAGQAAPPAQEGGEQERLRPDQYAYVGFEDLPRLAPAEATEPSAPDGPAGPVIDWSVIAFERYIDSNWDIFYAPANGSAYYRVTTDSSYDVHPHLMRGGGVIVFARRIDGSYELLRINPDGSGVVRLTENGTDEVYPTWSPDGTRILFQAYRDGNPEIYVMNADGSNQTRLTADPDYDGMPSWSPGGSRIAFVSRRTGGYRIYTMNADGTDLVQLNTQAYSESPHWSPDGTRIAYDADSDGDGYQELWVMNADGSGQLLVYNPFSGNTDAWASGWSPNSQYISYTQVHYVYYYGQWYWDTGFIRYIEIYGTPHAFFSYSPTDWSADWQALDAQPPVSWINTLPLESPYQFTVSWAGYDDGPAEINSYDVQVRDGVGGVWTDWQARTPETSAVYTGWGGHEYYFRARAWDNAFNGEAYPPDYDAFTRVESRSPITWMDPLPPLLRYGDVTVAWNGFDPGGSGLLDFDLQVRDSGTGLWVNWLSNTTATSASYTGQAGHTYDFRVRAEDMAHNVGDWGSDAGDAHITFYAWQISGLALDVREAPLGGVEASPLPAPLLSVPSGEDGFYTAYTGQLSGSTTASWSREGFGSLPETTYGAEDRFTVVYLQTADDLVSDGGFEGGDLEPAWQPAGVYTPTLTSAARHTGQAAAFLGLSPVLEAPVNLTPEDVDVGFPVSFVDAAGTLHVAWESWDGVQDSIRYAYRTVDGAWSATEAVQISSIWASDPAIVVDAAGFVHVLWEESWGYYQVFYAYRDLAGVWSPPQLVGDVDSLDPQMVIDAAGSIHAIWLHGAGVAYAQLPAEGAWTEPQILETGDNQINDINIVLDGQDAAMIFYIYDAIYSARCELGGVCSEFEILHSTLTTLYVFSAVIDSSGAWHIAWLEDVNYPNWVTYAFYQYRSPTGEWSPIHQVAGSLEATTLEMGVSEDGRTHIVFGTDDDLFYAWRQADGRWSPYPINLTNSPGDWDFEPELAVTASGAVTLAWTHDEGSDYIDIFISRLIGDEWTPPVNLSNDSNFSYGARLSLSEYGDLNVLWMDYDDVHTRMYTVGLERLSQDGEALLSQTIAIPAEMVNPTLSFLYQMAGGGPGSGSGFDVRVETEDLSTTIFGTALATGPWEHVWVDMTPWVSQTITLTFAITEAAGYIPLYLHLDEVSLGPVYADAQTALHGLPAAALPGDQITFQLGYGNLNSVLAESAVLTLTLPADLDFISASLPPDETGDDLVWYLGDLPPVEALQSIDVSVAVNATAPGGDILTTQASIACLSPEAETDNNTAAAETYVGVYLFLPFTFK